MNCLHICVICVINIMFHYLTSYSLYNITEYALFTYVVIHMYHIPLYNITEYALFTYVIHMYHIPLYNITEYALFTYVIHIYHIPLYNITDFAHKLNVMFHYIKS